MTSRYEELRTWECCGERIVSGSVKNNRHQLAADAADSVFFFRPIFGQITGIMQFWRRMSFTEFLRDDSPGAGNDSRMCQSRAQQWTELSLELPHHHEYAYGQITRQKFSGSATSPEPVQPRATQSGRLLTTRYRGWSTFCQ